MENSISFVIGLFLTKFSLGEIISFVVGGVAIWLSVKYNKETTKMLNDTKFLSVQQIILLNKQKKYMIVNQHKEELCFEKDGIQLRKLKSYSKVNVSEVIKQLQCFNIKKKTINQINDFLTNEETELKANFWGSADSDGSVDIEGLYAVFLKYSIVMIVDYRTW